MRLCAALSKRKIPLQALCTLLCFLATTMAYPELFIENGFSNGCIDHPSRGYGGHGKPVADRTTTFIVAAPGSSAPVTSVCPGGSYSVKVAYGASERRTLLTTSAGSLAAATDPSCPGRSYSEAIGSNYMDTLNVPCTATGSIQLVVTSAAGSSKPFQEASTSLTVKPLSQCTASPCAGAAAAAAPTPKPAVTRSTAAAAASVKANSTPTAAAAAAAAPAPSAPAVTAMDGPSNSSNRSSLNGSSSGNSNACDGSSPFGYACSIAAGSGAVLHYTQGGRAPDNVCTRALVGGVENSVSNTPGNKPLHFLLESPLGGYAGLSFPQKKGVMVPADAVIGFVDPGTAQPVVAAYHLTDYAVQQSPTNFAGLGWAERLGAAKVDGKTVVCFTRMTDAPAAAVMKSLNLQGVGLNWAANDATAFDTHTLQGSLTVDMESGQAAAISSSNTDSNLKALLAHGALMLTAFVGLMPLGALLSRHKWVCGNKPHGGIKGTWFAAHRAVQVAALLLGLAGFIIALVVVDDPWDTMGASDDQLFNLHRVLGVVVIALAVLQAIAGFARPSLTAPHRLWWRMAHMGLGYITILAGIVVCFVGAALMHENLAQPWLTWMLPIALILGLLLLVAVVGEVFKTRLQRSGWYHPPSHSFSDPSTRTDKLNTRVPTSVIV